MSALFLVTYADIGLAQQIIFEFNGSTPSSGTTNRVGASAAFGLFDTSDSVSDLMVGSPGFNGYRGTIYVLSGPFDNSSPSWMEISQPPLAAGAQLGWSIAFAPTFRFADPPPGQSVFIAGAPGAAVRKGQAFEYFILGSLQRLTIDPSTLLDAEDHFGYVVSMCDFDGDGYSDIVVGTDHHVSDALKGKVFVFLGGNGADTQADLMVYPAYATAPYTYSTFGNVLCGTKDIDDDGYDDVIIGNSGNDLVHILYGRDLSQATGNPVTIGLLGDGTDPRVKTISYVDIIGCTGGGDVTGDEEPDIVLANNDGVTVYHGPVSETSDMSQLVYVKVAGGSSFGRSLNLGGDADGDGVNDLLIGGLSGPQGTNRGRIVVMLGGQVFPPNHTISCLTSTPSTRKVWQVSPPQLANNSEFGVSLGYLGDQTSDGRDEIFAGAPGALHANGAPSGALFGIDLVRSPIVIADEATPILTGPLCDGETSRVLAIRVDVTPTTPIQVFVDATNLNMPSELRLYDDGPGGGHGDAAAGDNIYSQNLTGMTYGPEDPVQVEVFARADNVNGGFALKNVEVEFMGTQMIDAQAEFPVPRIYGSPFPLYAIHTTPCGSNPISFLRFFGDQSIDDVVFNWGDLVLYDDGPAGGHGDATAGDHIYSFRGQTGFAPEIPPAGFYEFRVEGFIDNMPALADVVQIEVVDPEVNYVNRSGATGLNYPGQPYSSVVMDFDGTGSQDMFISLVNQNAKLYKCASTPTVVPYFLAASALETGGELPPASLLGLAVADYDNDGHQDLFAASQTAADVRLYQAGEDNNGRFLQDVSNPIRAVLAPALTGAWGDYDRDGRVDLFVGRGSTTGEPGVDPNGSSYPGILLRNNTASSQGFADVSSALGFGGPPATYCATATWGDFDNDKFPDLFVGDASPSGTSRLFRNDRNGHFIDESANRLGAAVSSVVGAGFFYANDDGDVDLAIARSTNASVRLNSGNPQGYTLTEAVNVESMSSISGLKVFDYNSDGLQDVLLLPASTEAPKLCKARSGDLAYVNVAGEVNLNETAKTGGCVVSDFNADGDLDLYLGRTVAGDASDTFFFTASGETPADDTAFVNWVCVKLKSDIGVPNNYLGIGAKVTVTQGPTSYVRVVDGGSGRGSQDDQALLFGLPTNGAVDIAVDWPNGYQQQRNDVAVRTTELIDDNTTGFSVTGAAGSYAIIPNTTQSKWTFKWVTSVGTNPALDRIVYKIGDPNWQNGGTTVWATSPGVVHTEFVGTLGLYQHQLVISSVPCTVGQTIYFAVKSEGAPGQVVTGQTRSFYVSVCGTEYQPNQP